MLHNFKSNTFFFFRLHTPIIDIVRNESDDTANIPTIYELTHDARLNINRALIQNRLYDELCING